MCYTLTLCHAWNIYILSLANYLRFSPDWLLLVLSCCGAIVYRCGQMQVQVLA